MALKIKMLTSIAGVDFSVSRGETTDRFSDGDVERMLAAGMAELVDDAPKSKPDQEPNKTNDPAQKTEDDAKAEADKEAVKSTAKQKTEPKPVASKKEGKN